MKKTLKSILALTLAVLLMLSFAGCGKEKEEPKTSIAEITGQEVLSDSTSPDGKYTVTAYYNSDNEDGSDYAVLCVIKNNNSGEERNIYYNTEGANANIQWSNDKTVVINGIVIDAENGSFDSREK